MNFIKSKILPILKNLFSDKKVRIWITIFSIPPVLLLVTIFAVYQYYLPEIPPLSQLENITQIGRAHV